MGLNYIEYNCNPYAYYEIWQATPLLKESGSMNLLKDVEHVCPQYISAPTPPPRSPPDESQRSSDDVTAQPENHTGTLNLNQRLAMWSSHPSAEL